MSSDWRGYRFRKIYLVRNKFQSETFIRVYVIVGYSAISVEWGLIPEECVKFAAWLSRVEVSGERSRSVSETSRRRKDDSCCKLHASRKRPRAHVSYDTFRDHAWSVRFETATKQHVMFPRNAQAQGQVLFDRSKCACATGLLLSPSEIGHFAYATHGSKIVNSVRVLRKQI